MMSIPTLCNKQDLFRVFNLLTDMVKAQYLLFPDLVVKDCERYALNEPVHAWIKAVAGFRRYKSAPGEWHEEVLGLCDGLADLDDDTEQTQVHVASMALMNDNQGVNLAVVTEDRNPLPTRMCLFDACHDLGLKAISARELVVLAGGSDALLI
jgi:hypothetical protein